MFKRDIVIIRLGFEYRSLTIKDSEFCSSNLIAHMTHFVTVTTSQDSQHSKQVTDGRCPKGQRSILCDK